MNHYIEINVPGDDCRKKARLSVNPSKVDTELERLKKELPQYEVRYVVSSVREKVFNHIPMSHAN